MDEAKQKISQTDLLIEKLYGELSFLSQKLEHLEKDKVGKKELSQELEKHHSLIDDLQNSYEKQETNYRENIKIALKMVQKIEEPITNVSDSLQKISNKTKEFETKKSLDSCLATLEKLKKQCTDSNSYFDTLLAEKQFSSKEYSLQELFSVFQKHPLQPFVKFPSIAQEQVIIHWDLLEKIHYQIFEFLYKEALVDKGVKIMFQSIPPELALSNKWTVCTSFYFATKEKLVWNEKWEDSLSYTQEQKNKIPLKWLHWKKELNQYQGDFYIEEENLQIQGFSVLLPFQPVNS
jgi:hypothetical protein